MVLGRTDTPAIRARVHRRLHQCRTSWRAALLPNDFAASDKCVLICEPFCVFTRQARFTGASGTSTARVLSYQDFPKLQGPVTEFSDFVKIVIFWGAGVRSVVLYFDGPGGIAAAERHFSPQIFLGAPPSLLLCRFVPWKIEMSLGRRPTVHPAQDNALRGVGATPICCRPNGPTVIQEAVGGEPLARWAGGCARGADASAGRCPRCYTQVAGRRS